MTVLPSMSSLQFNVSCVLCSVLQHCRKMAAKQEQMKLGFIENFSLSGAAAVISKTAAAPIERVKLLVQNQDEMLKTGRLTKPYKGVIDCTVRTYRTEGMQHIAC